MTSENATKLKSRALNGSIKPTPKQVTSNGESLQFFKELEKMVGADFPYDLIPLFYAKKGGLDGFKFATFKKSAKPVIEHFGDKALTFLTSRCIKQDGSINFRRLKREIDK